MRHKKFHTAWRFIQKGHVLFVFGIGVALVLAFSSQAREPFSSAEVKFTDNSAGGLIIVPASCPSVPENPDYPHDTCSTACVPETGQSCNLNSCGMAGGTYQCDGSCSGPTPSDSLCTPMQVCTPGEWSSTMCARCGGNGQWHASCTDYGLPSDPGHTTALWCNCAINCADAASIAMCTPTALPDLYTSPPVFYQGSLAVGGNPTFYGNIGNAGTVGTGAFNNIFVVDLNNDGGWDLTYAQSGYVSSLGGGASTLIYSQVIPLPAGTHAIEICADFDTTWNPPYSNMVAESNEGNNCGAKLVVTIDAPNLPDAPTLTANCTAGTGSLSWNAVAGATDYQPMIYVPIDDSCPTGWTDGGTSVANQNRSCFITGYTGTSITASLITGHSYTAYVYSHNAAGNSATPSEPKSFMCTENSVDLVPWGPWLEGQSTGKTNEATTNDVLALGGSAAAFVQTIGAAFPNIFVLDGPSGYHHVFETDSPATLTTYDPQSTEYYNVLRAHVGQLAAGTYTEQFCVDKHQEGDPSGAIVETNEANNCSTPFTFTVVPGSNDCTDPNDCPAPAQGCNITASPLSAFSGDQVTLGWASACSSLTDACFYNFLPVVASGATVGGIGNVSPTETPHLPAVTVGALPATYTLSGYLIYYPFGPKVSGSDYSCSVTVASSQCPAGTTLVDGQCVPSQCQFVNSVCLADGSIYSTFAPPETCPPTTSPSCQYGCVQNGNSAGCFTPVLPTVKLSVAPQLVRSGTRVTVSWTSTGGTEDVACTVTGTNGDQWSGGGSDSGEQSAPITAQTTYSLHCTGSIDGLSTPIQTATVNLVPIFQEK